MKSVIIESAINIKILNIIAINEITINPVAILVIKLLLKLLKNNAAIDTRNIKHDIANNNSIKCIVLFLQFLKYKATFLQLPVMLILIHTNNFNWNIKHI